MAKAKKKPSFEDALERVETIVDELEAGELGLDESLKKYEEGVKALRECQKILAAAEKRIEVLTRLDEDGNPVTEPFDRADSTAPGLDEETD